MTEHRPIIRFGPATITAVCLLLAAFASQYLGAFQLGPGWNRWIDILAKNALVLILVEAMAVSVQRVWAVQATLMLASLWWVKAGLRLSAAGATYAGGRVMGPAVGLVENPNGFAYMMCVLIPLYLYFYQQEGRKWVRMAFLALALCGVYIVFQTGSRTGMLVLIVIGFFLLPKYGRHHRKSLVVAAIAVAMILPLSAEQNIQRFKSIPASFRAFLSGEEKGTDELTQDEQSAQERRLKNRDTWRLITDYPLFGVGINPNEGLIIGPYPYAAGQVHCEILMAGRQMGFIGMGLYSAFLVIMFVLGRRIEKQYQHTWPAVADLGWTFKMQTLVFLVGGAFSPLPWNAPELILVGSVSVLWTQLKSDSVGQVSSPEAGGVSAMAPATLSAN